MPYYDYLCPHCRQTIEIQHKMSEKKTRCPKCGQEGLERQLSAASFKLVGGGFYATDYRHKK